MQEFTGYRVTASGREEAARCRRFRREHATEVALGRELPRLRYPWLTDSQRMALERPLRDLESAFDDERAPAAIGSAKELFEFVCKIVLAHAGEHPGAAPSLSALFTQTRRAIDVPDGDLGRSLAATVSALSLLRNTAGSGHGHADAPSVGIGEARLAAGGATALAAFLLDSVK